MANPQPNKFTRISNELLEALAKIRIPGEARQVLDVLFRKIYGFHKKSDTVAISQFMLATGLKKVAVCKAIKKLIDLNLITKKGNRVAFEYAINKDFETWNPLPKKVMLPKKVTPVTKKGNKPLPKKDTTKDINIKKKDNGDKKAKKPANKKANAWGIWIDVNREFKRSDPLRLPKDLSASKNILKSLDGDADKYADVLRQFLNDRDKFLVNNGHGLSFLYSRINKYLNNSRPSVPDIDDPYENNPPSWQYYYELAMETAGFVDQKLADDAGFKSLTKAEWEVEREQLGIKKAT